MPRQHDQHTDFTQQPGNPAHYFASHYDELMKRVMEDPEAAKQGIISDLQSCVGRGCSKDRYRQICQIVTQKAQQGAFALAKYISDFVLKATDRDLGVVQTGPRESVDWRNMLANRANNSLAVFLEEHFDRLMKAANRQPLTVARELKAVAPSSHKDILEAIGSSPKAIRRYIAENFAASQGDNRVVREATETASLDILAESIDSEIEQTIVDRMLGKYGYLLETLD